MGYNLLPSHSDFAYSAMIPWKYIALLLAKPIGRKCLIWLQTLIQRFIRTNEERSTTAAFLKGDKKRGGDSADDPWQGDPRSRD